MHIKFKKFMQCKQAHDYAHIKCNQSKFMSLLSLLVCFSCLRLLILLNSSMLLPLCPLSMSKSLIVMSLSQSLPKLFISLYNLSSFVINFHKRCASLDIKGCIGVDGWHLNLAFFMDTTICWNDTTCIPWDHSCRIFDLDTNRWGTSPYVIAWVIHLINLSSC